MVTDRMRTGQGIAQAELSRLREEHKTQRAELSTRKAEFKSRKAEALAEREKSKGFTFKKKQEAKAQAKERAKLEKFSNKVVSQNVQGIIPPVENRGVHNMVTFNPFSVPEKIVERDSRTGLLRVKNSIWG